MKYQYIVGKGESGNRIDRFICAKLPNFSRKKIKGLLDSGSVFVNNRKVVIAGWELAVGNKVEVVVSETGKTVSRRRLHVYYEDRDLIVVEKPAGLISVPTEKNGESLVSEIHAYIKRRHPNYKRSFVLPLHRLDAETSGVMVFALSREGEKLEYQFRDHKIKREYIAIVKGQVKGDGGIIDSPLEKGTFGGGKKVREVGSGLGKKAVTEYQVKERYSDATLLDIKVRTGRTHQIRVHLAGKGHPILGDKLYFENEDSPLINRQALHALTLGFTHPVSGKKLTFRSNIPHDMKEVIDKLRMG